MCRFLLDLENSKDSSLNTQRSIATAEFFHGNGLGWVFGGNFEVKRERLQWDPVIHNFPNSLKESLKKRMQRNFKITDFLHKELILRVKSEFEGNKNSWNGKTFEYGLNSCRNISKTAMFSKLWPTKHFHP